MAGNAASAVFLYDTVLDITWLRNANSGAGSIYDDTGFLGSGGTTTDGLMTWANAVAWANSLNGSTTVGGTTGWRLPTMIDTGPAACPVAAYSGTDCGWNALTKSGNLTEYQAGQTVFSEMAHLFYVTLGNKAFYSTSGVGSQPGWGLVNRGDFQNLQEGGYWSGLTVAPPVTDGAWIFIFGDGGQGYNFKTNSGPGLAVRSGDVLTTAVAPAAVPLPAAAWLMLSGIGALGVAARRRQPRTNA